MTPEHLHGAWLYQAWEIRYADGRCTMPFGPGASGLLVYTPDGFMSATIMAGDRQALSVGNPRLATAAEKAAAFDSYFSYAGRWSLQGERVRHDVTLALNPGLLGTLQWRDAELSEQQLILSAKENTPAGDRQHVLIWSRSGG